MPIDPSALRDAGGFFVALALSLTIIEGFRRGWWVPGFVYRREVERGDRMEQLALTTAKAAKARRGERRRESDEQA